MLIALIDKFKSYSIIGIISFKNVIASIVQLTEHGK